jgi:D-alanyl-D-alanine carboxypeptidase (penicillin-binding protein 5/6)
MTAPDSKTRFSEAISLLNYGFANCYIYMDDEDFVIDPVSVTGGNKSSVGANPEKSFSYMFMSKPDTDKISRRFEMRSDVTAPVAEGDIVGEIIYEYEGKELGRVSILAAEGVAKAQFSDAVRKVFTDFLN